MMKRMSEKEIIKRYEAVLRGDEACFPNNIWDCEHSLFYAKVLTKYLIEKVIKCKDDDDILSLKYIDFTSNKLGGMLSLVFSNKIYKLIENAYPKRFNVWEYKVKPHGIWEDEKNIIGAVKWLIEKKKKMKMEDVPRLLTTDVIKEHRFDNLIKLTTKTVDGSKLFNLVNKAYPNKFKPWEFTVPNSFWQGDQGRQRAIMATRWMIEDKLKLKPEEIPYSLNLEKFGDCKLTSMLIHVYNYDITEAIIRAYPNQFRISDFHRKMTLPKNVEVYNLFKTDEYKVAV